MKNFLKRWVPRPVISILRYIKSLPAQIHEQYLIRTQPRLYKLAVAHLRKKEGPINVVFFAIFKSVWKYDGIYRLMEADKRFYPIVLVCPVVNNGRDFMLETLHDCYSDFKERGYHVICAYDKTKDCYIDVKSLSPDIIFYTNPYHGLIDDRYYITNFRDTLTCYVSYHFGNSSNYSVFNDSLLQNLAWRLFAESDIHKHFYQKFTRGKGKNVVVSGYPGVDDLIRNSPQNTAIWKIKDPSVKRIIWAPHHSFDGDCPVHYSTFLRYSRFMIDIAVKYKGKIQIAFKPHPLLKVKLNQYWGIERTTEYYKQWELLENGLLFEDEYTDLFLTSDAIMHDCGSFIAEYLYTRKPALRIDGAPNSVEEFNPFAQQCLSMYYHANCEEQIEQFIRDIIENNDPMKNKRDDFYNRVLLPPNGITASENIVNYLKKELLEIV